MAQKRVSKEVFKALKNIGYSDNSLLFFICPKISDVVEWFRENGLYISVQFSMAERMWTPWVEVETYDHIGTMFYFLPANTKEYSKDFYKAMENGIIKAIDYIYKNKITKKNKKLWQKKL